MKNLCRLYIVRHGETEWNVIHRMQGQKDSKLTAKGEGQAKNLGNKLRNIKFDAVFSSDLLRAKRTAEIIKLERDLDIATSKVLRERTFGEFEGMSGVEYQRQTEKLFKKYQQLSEDKKLKFKFGIGYESDEEILSRFITILREIGVGFLNKNVLVVTHGGMIRTFLYHLGYAKMSELGPGSFENSGYIVVESDGVDFFLKQVIGHKPITLLI